MRRCWIIHGRAAPWLPSGKTLLFDPSPDLNGSSPLPGSRWTRETGKFLHENEIHFADPVPQPLLSTRVNWRVENKSFTHFSPRGETGHLSQCLKSDAPQTGSGKEMSRLPVQYRPGQTVTNQHVPAVGFAEDQTHLLSLLFPETIPTCQRFGHKL